MPHFDDFKVLTASAVAILVSYLNITPLDGFRYAVLLATFLYTLRKWYLMEKNNNKDE